MESRLKHLMDQIEVPSETVNATENMLLNELLCTNTKNSTERKNTTKIQLESKRGKLYKIIAACAALFIVSVGISTAFITLYTPKTNGTLTNPPTIATSTPNNELINRLRSHKMYELTAGVNRIDLNLDGIDEEIILTNIDTDTSFKQFQIQLGDQTISGEVDRDEGPKLRAAMLTKEQDSIQLLFTYLYLSDDFLTDIYNYENGKLVKVGTFHDEVDNIKINEDGSFEITQQNGLLGLMKDTTVSLVPNTNADFSITGIYSLSEEDHFAKETTFEYSIQALQSVPLYKSMDRNSSSIAAIAVGEKCKTITIYNGQWLYLETADGITGYLEINLGNFIINGESIKGETVFDGLPFAG